MLLDVIRCGPTAVSRGCGCFWRWRRRRPLLVQANEAVAQPVQSSNVIETADGCTGIASELRSQGGPAGRLAARVAAVEPRWTRPRAFQQPKQSSRTRLATYIPARCIGLRGWRYELCPRQQHGPHVFTACSQRRTQRAGNASVSRSRIGAWARACDRQPADDCSDGGSRGGPQHRHCAAPPLRPPAGSSGVLLWQPCPVACLCRSRLWHAAAAPHGHAP
jgi:hypothetical protein